MTYSLILAAHGTTDGPAFREVLEPHAERLRRLCIFRDVTTAYWKEPVYFRDAVAACASDEIIVVPFFASEGYYTRSVLPRELGLGDGANDTGRTVRLARAVGTHRGWCDRLAGVVDGVLAARGIASAATTLLLIGHGTRRHADSAKSVELLTSSLKRLGCVRDVQCCFLDQEPGIDSAVDRVRTEEVLAIPFLVANGVHAAFDVGSRLGLTVGSALDVGEAANRPSPEAMVGESGGRRVILTRTVFGEAWVTDMIVDLACEVVEVPLRDSTVEGRL
ncbi:MAG: hypothetical protein IID36_12385 [Planctomycetes bacterium]|nr:hypothetical protein [Planctomycetota bacterium]